MDRSDDRALFRSGFVVAIDGPSGAGKSTVSRQLAVALGGVLLDTGAMYRAVAYHSLRQGAKTAGEFARIARALKFDIDRDTQLLLVDGADLGPRLRTEKVSEMASLVSRYKGVRAALTRRQRALGKTCMRRAPVVVEGRDIGTIVFPQVRFKFYVTADAKVRAARRYRELKRHGHRDARLKEVLRQIQLRDEQDSHRSIAPLRCPDDAIVVDTSSMGITQVVHFLVDHIRGALSIPSGKRV